MTNQSIKNEVKKLNRRLVQMAEDFGIDSATYKNAIASLSSTKFSNITHKTKKGGVLQLDANNTAIADKDFKHALNILRRNAKTLTHFRENAKETKADIIARVENTSTLNSMINSQINYLYEHYTKSERKSIFPFLYEKGELTDDEIMEILAWDKEEIPPSFDELDDTIDNYQ